VSQAKFESQAEIEIALTAAMTDPNLSSLPQPTDMIDCRLQPAGQHDIAAVARQGDYYDLCARLPSHCWAYEFISPKPGATWPHSRTVGGDRVHSESPVWIWGATKLLLYSKDWRRGSTLACLSMPQQLGNGLPNLSGSGQISSAVYDVSWEPPVLFGPR